MGADERRGQDAEEQLERRGHVDLRQPAAREPADQVKRVFDHLAEGVMLLDMQGRIILGDNLEVGWATALGVFAGALTTFVLSLAEARRGR